LPSRADNGDFGGVSGSSIKLQVPSVPADALHNGMDPRSVWCCVFCGKDSRFLSIGSIYGPYFLPSTVLKELSKDCLFSLDSKSNKSSGKLKNIKNDDVFVSETERVVPSTGEFWTHMECALWAPGTFFDGSRLDGWSEAVPLALQSCCTCCGLIGAVVGCSERGCTRAYHYLCAIETNNVELQEEKFCLLCPDHSKK